MVDTQDKDGVFNRFKLWKEYEGVAMHFNDLIIKLRSQSLGAVAAFATLAGVVAKSDTSTEFRWGLLAGAFALLIFFWIAVWILDLGYYNRLLAGAVEAIVAIEKESGCSATVNAINLSTKIEDMWKPGRKVKVKNNCTRKAFYIVVFVALLAGLVFSLCKYCFVGLR